MPHYTELGRPLRESRVPFWAEDLEGLVLEQKEIKGDIIRVCIYVNCCYEEDGEQCFSLPRRTRHKAIGCICSQAHEISG